RRRVRVLDLALGVDAEDDVARTLDDVPEACVLPASTQRDDEGCRQGGGEEDQGGEGDCHCCFSWLLSRIQGKGPPYGGQGKGSHRGTRRTRSAFPTSYGEVWRGLVRSRRSDGSAPPGARQGL